MDEDFFTDIKDSTYHHSSYSGFHNSYTKTKSVFLLLFIGTLTFGGASFYQYIKGMTESAELVTSQKVVEDHSYSDLRQVKPSKPLKLQRTKAQQANLKTCQYWNAKYQNDAGNYSRLMRDDACKRAGIVFKPRRQQQRAIIVASSNYGSYQQEQVTKMVVVLYLFAKLIKITSIGFKVECVNHIEHLNIITLSQKGNIGEISYLIIAHAIHQVIIRGVASIESTFTSLRGSAVRNKKANTALRYELCHPSLYNKLRIIHIMLNYIFTTLRLCPRTIPCWSRRMYSYLIYFDYFA